MLDNPKEFQIASGVLYAVGAIPIDSESHVIGCVIALQPEQLKELAPFIAGEVALRAQPEKCP